MNFLLVTILVLSSCSKADQPVSEMAGVSPVDESRAKAEFSIYRYLDRKLPLSILVPKRIGRDTAEAEYGHESRIVPYKVRLWALTKGNNGRGGVDLVYLRIFLYQSDYLAKKHPSNDNYKDPVDRISRGLRENLHPSSCYDEVPYEKGIDGIKRITQNLLVEQIDGTYAQSSVPAEFQVLTSNTDPSDGDDPCPPGFPCAQEKHRIIPQLPQGLVPPGKSVVIEAQYTVTNADEPEDAKKDKKDADAALCQALKGITWVSSSKIGLPPDWSQITWPETYPIVNITAEKWEDGKRVPIP